MNPCLLSPCGTNARCNANARSSTAQCVCNEGYTGDPYTRCNLDPCYDSPCGPNSRCEVQGLSARCTCDRGEEENDEKKIRNIWLICEFALNNMVPLILELHFLPQEKGMGN